MLPDLHRVASSKRVLIFRVAFKADGLSQRLVDTDQVACRVVLRSTERFGILRAEPQNGLQRLSGFVEVAGGFDSQSIRENSPMHGEVEVDFRSVLGTRFVGREPVLGFLQQGVLKEKTVLVLVFLLDDPGKRLP